MIATSVNFRVARMIRNRIETQPDRLAEILAAESNPAAVEGILRADDSETLELLGADLSAASLEDDEGVGDE